jgi:hypothetical protein
MYIPHSPYTTVGSAAQQSSGRLNNSTCIRPSSILQELLGHILSLVLPATALTSFSQAFPQFHPLKLHPPLHPSCHTHNSALQFNPLSGHSLNPMLALPSRDYVDYDTRCHPIKVKRRSDTLEGVQQQHTHILRTTVHTFPSQT